MNDLPLVTVGIPVYNAERFLPSGLDSLLSQTYSNFEILLADDGSTDSTASLCDEIAAGNERVRVLHCQHQGVGAMRNVLVENAKGDYFYFCDIDDWVEPDLLERNVAAMERGGFDMACFGFMVENVAAGTKDVVRHNPIDLNTNEELKAYYCNQLAGLEYGFGFLPMKFFSLPFLRRMFAQGIRFEHIPMHEDEIFLLALLPHVTKACLLSEVFYHYIFYPKGNTSTSFRANGMDYTLMLYNRRMALSRDWVGDNDKLVGIYREQLLTAVAYGLTRREYYKHSGLGCWRQYKYVARMMALPEVRECARSCRMQLCENPKSIFSRLMDKYFYANRPLPFYIVRSVRDFYKRLKSR